MSTGTLQSSRLRRVISVKPYGENLLTAGAANWIFITRLIVVIMALSEAVSWGYLGGLFLTSSARYLSAFIAGSFVFLIIWGIDVSLMTLDRARPIYERALYNKKSAHPIRDRIKEVTAFVTRWFIVTASLFITAPFLAQIIFGVDIRREIAAETTQIISTARRQIDESYLKKIQQIEQSLVEDRRELTEEVAGRLRSGSGLYGEGPVARTIEARIVAAEETLATLNKARTDELSQFDMAVAHNNYEEIRNRWGVILPENSIVKRGEVLAKIVQVPTYTKTELAIRAFLFFLFLSLFILKLFEPRSIKLYLSEALQQEWQRYKAGAFNTWLAKDEKSDANPCSMTPFRFEDLMINVYPVVRAEDMTRRQSVRVEEAAKDGSGRLEEIRTEIEHEIQSQLAIAQNRLAGVTASIATLAKRKGELEGEITLGKKDVKRCEEDVQSFNPLESGKLPKAQEIQRVKLRALKVEAEGIMLEALNRLEEAEQQLIGVEREINSLQNERTKLTSRIGELENEIRLVNRGLEEIRKRRIEDAVSRGKSNGDRPQDS